MVLNVRVDTDGMRELYKGIEKAVPRITYRALNETAKAAKSRAEKATATKIKLPLKLIRKRLDKSGNVKADRSTIKKARANDLITVITVYMRGVPVYQIAGKPTKNQRKRPGVKAKGGRLYEGAFYAPNNGGKPLVLKRRARGKLMLPKIGVREMLSSEYEKEINSAKAIADYTNRWNRLAQYEFAKINQGLT